MKAVPAAGTEIPAYIGDRSALGALSADRIAKQKVQDKTQSVWNEDDECRPQRPAHASPARISIHVTHHQYHHGKESGRNQRDQHLKSQMGRIPEVPPDEHVKADLDKHEDNCGDNVRRSRNDRDLSLECCHCYPQFAVTVVFRHTATAAMTVAGKNHHIRKLTCHVPYGA